MKIVAKLVAAALVVLTVNSAMASDFIQCLANSPAGTGKTCKFYLNFGQSQDFKEALENASAVSCWLPTENHIEGGSVKVILNGTNSVTWNTNPSITSVDWAVTGPSAQVEIVTSNLTINGPQPFVACDFVK